MNRQTRDVLNAIHSLGSDGKEFILNNVLFSAHPSQDADLSSFTLHDEVQTVAARFYRTMTGLTDVHPILPDSFINFSNLGLVQAVRFIELLHKTG